MRIEIAYARPDCQVLEELELPAGTCVRDAVTRARLQERFPEIDLARDGAGLFGRRVALDRVLQEGDRVEVYRPLQIDPKERRRRLARSRQSRGDRNR